MKKAEKKCKGTGKAINHGCGNPVYRFRYGLCKQCFQDWLINSEEGRLLIKKTMLKSKPKKAKPKRKYTNWKEKDLPELKKYVQSKFCNPYIRERDKVNHLVCISSGKEINDAGHYFSRGSCESMRFCIQNIHGQNRWANTAKHGDIQNFTIGIINRHGLEYYEGLLELKKHYSTGKHLDKEKIIKIAETYKYLLANKMWIYTQKKFDEIEKNIE